MTRLWQMAGRLNRPSVILSLPALLVLIGLGLVPLLLITFWSFWSFDPATYWIKPEMTMASYRALAETGRLPVFVRTLGLAAVAAAFCTAIAFPASVVIGFMSSPRRATILLALFTIPFFTSALTRAFAWRLVLGRAGIVNTVLMAVGIVDHPLEWLLFSNFAVLVGMIAAYLPFAVVPMVLVLARIEPSVIRASQDLGAGFWTTLGRIVLPLSTPGVIAGFLFVFVVALSTSTEIQLLGGAADSSISIMINDVMRVVNFPLAFAIATAVVVLLSLIVIFANRALGLSRMFEELGS
jgi:ABC-type spermidine/putrescine transport system permease subunit I